MAVSMSNHPLYKYTLFHMKRRPSPYVAAQPTSYLEPRVVCGDSSLAKMLYPTRSCTWIRGSPVCIQWTVHDENILTVRIELCQWGSNAVTLLATHAPNTGCYVYSKVPWGVIGDNFYLRISDSENSNRFITSDYFRIGNPRQGW
ncbi:hypothetical protein THRCLA_06030 [Thraustotheca clavata]|uniref:Uncharacterized protein n=1 Tax=Thraustotheca clavata TaxID=74557 RepID=A0A1V9ZQN0_9STRA|nr:hypothetical protein THRCLA_06030 [Thraustotheca clavata]